MFINELKNAAKIFDINFNDKQVEQFDNFYNLLIEWNKKINLTAITEPHDAAIKHMIDSISFWNDDRFSNVETIIDVGTGAGFPGIPLKIFRPSIKLTLLDSLAKRVKFLNNVIDKLNLTNVECIHARAEDAARNDKLREKFDLVVSRAVAKLNILSEYCLPFTKINGTFIALKGANINQEIEESENAIKMLGGNNINLKAITLPNGDERNIIYIAKKAITPLKFPRKAGLPEKKPL